MHNDGPRIPYEGKDNSGGEPGEKELSGWTKVQCLLLPGSFRNGGTGAWQRFATRSGLAGSRSDDILLRSGQYAMSRERYKEEEEKNDRRGIMGIDHDAMSHGDNRR